MAAVAAVVALRARVNPMRAGLPLIRVATHAIAHPARKAKSAAMANALRARHVVPRANWLAATMVVGRAVGAAPTIAGPAIKLAFAAFKVVNAACH